MIARELIDEIVYRNDIEQVIPMERSQVAEVVLGLCFTECGKRLFGFVPCWGCGRSSL